VRNYNLLSGNYEKASSHFENIAKRYPDHAFAHYCLSKSYEGSGNDAEKRFTSGSGPGTEYR
jgi:TolA-binding protein